MRNDWNAFGFGSGLNLFEGIILEIRIFTKIKFQKRCFDSHKSRSYSPFTLWNKKPRNVNCEIEIILMNFEGNSVVSHFSAVVWQVPRFFEAFWTGQKGSTVLPENARLFTGQISERYSSIPNESLEFPQTFEYTHTPCSSLRLFSKPNPKNTAIFIQLELQNLSFTMAQRAKWMKCLIKQLFE